MCLFEKRHKRLEKLFKNQLRQRSNYQLSGDQKSEDEMQIDFLNSIDFKPNYSFQRDSLQARPNIFPSLRVNNPVKDSINNPVKDSINNPIIIDTPKEEEKKKSY
jgi:hypothetical protein